MASEAAGNKVCLLVGGTTGIGKEAAVQLVALGGWDVYVTGRSVERAQAAAASVNEGAGVPANASYGATGGAGSAAVKAGTGHSGAAKGRCFGAGPLDLGRLGQVRSFADEWLGGGRRTDALLLNAGICNNRGAKEAPVTEDGFETTFATNHLGPFLLTRLLMPALLAAPEGPRIVVVSSLLHDPARPGSRKDTGLDFDDLQMRSGHRPYNSLTQYGNTKLMNMCFARELDARLKAQSGVHPSAAAVALHPGWIVTSDLIRDQGCLAMCCLRFCWTCCCGCCGKQQSLETGGATEAYCVTSPALKGGEYVGHDLKPHTPSAEARDDSVCLRLWKESERLLGLEAAPAGRVAP